MFMFCVLREFQIEELDEDGRVRDIDISKDLLH